MYQQPRGPWQPHTSYPPQQPWPPPQQQFPPNLQLQPPMQPPRPKRKTGLIIAIVGGMLFLMCVLCGGIVTAIGRSAPTTIETPTIVQSTSTKFAIIPTTTLTLKPTPSQTPHPTPMGAPTQAPTQGIHSGLAILGSDIGPFIYKYGQPNDHSGTNQYHFLRDATSPKDGLIVSTVIDSKHADGVTVVPVNGATWTTFTAAATCLSYTPRDAHETKRVELISSTGKDTGIDVIYVSAELSTVFPADTFTDGNGNMVSRGSFDIQYLYANDTSHIDDCSINTGMQGLTI